MGCWTGVTCGSMRSWSPKPLTSPLPWKSMLCLFMICFVDGVLFIANTAVSGGLTTEGPILNKLSCS